VKIRRVLELPDSAPVIDASMLSLCSWIAEYYAAPIGLVLRTALPAALTGADRATPTTKIRRIARIEREIPTLLERDRIFARSPRKRAVYEVLESLGGRAPVDLLLDRLRFTPGVLSGLARSGLIVVEEENVARDPFLTRLRKAPAPHVPSDAQRLALHHLTRAGPGATFLLHGVTGSGKTLVYIELLREIVERRGKGAIVLVPEIALTPQTVDRFRAVFGDSVAVLHSALSDGERYDAWRALASGSKRIAVGARSAVFAPIADLGAIVVDEEHETTYKQGETPRYHAREVAIIRARAAGAVVLLGSATPSLESWQNAASGKFTLLTLPERVGEAGLPSVEVVDRRTPHDRKDARPAVDAFRAVISEPLEQALGELQQARFMEIQLFIRKPNRTGEM
jgi:primosomal protein N' (replication factor Y)